jgi:3-oxoacyl-[acyl-carrier-protein] synthase-3
MRANCVTLDVNVACCGFIYALHAANACLAAYGYRYAVVVAAEALSRTVDWSDRSTCCLFGDAAGAVVLENNGKTPHFEFNVCGSAEHLRIGQGGDNCPFHSSNAKKHLEMDGQEIFKFAVSAIADRITGVLERTETSPGEVRAYLFHQANLRILKSAVSRLSLSWDQVPVNLDRLGNTSSATVAVLLDEVNRGGGLKRGDKLVLCAFGGGLASAACLLEW